MAASSPTAIPAKDGAKIRRVLLFDVDGTLVKSDPASNRVHKDAFTHGMATVMGPGFEGISIEEIQHQGMTDLWIVDVLLAKRGVPEGTIKERLPAINAAMVDYCQARRDQIGVSLLPGVRALLAELAGREDTLLGLVTGNLEPIAHMKLAASGLGGYFAFGGFGSDHYNRGELVKLAVQRAAGLYPGLDASQCLVYHTGDTRYDLSAAVYAGVRGVGVTTGNFPREVLETVEGGFHVILDDMSDLPRMRAVFELEGSG